ATAAGIDASRTIESAPFIPPSIATFFQELGIFEVAVENTLRMGYTDAALARLTATKATPMASAPVTSCPTSVLRPMKRNATELATNAIICQNDLTDTRAFWTTVVC